MADPLTPDLCIIGAGAAGTTLAMGAAAAGQSVVLIEKATPGGAHLHGSRIAAQAFRAAAMAAQSQRASASLGLKSREPPIDFAAIRANAARAADNVARNVAEQRLRALGITLINATARFTRKNQVVAGNVTVAARRFVIATGSKPEARPIPGLELIHALNADTIFDLPALPPRLVIIGATARGVELAQIFRRLGSDVTVLDSGAALADVDEELREPILAALRREGVRLTENAPQMQIEPRQGTSFTVALGEDGTVKTYVNGSHLCVTGHQAQMDSLCLDDGRVAWTRSGVVVNRHLRSVSNSHVYAIGSVAAIDGQAAEPSTHLAEHQADLLLLSLLLRRPARAKAHHIPRVIATEPELCTVGWREHEIKTRHRHCQVWRWPFGQNEAASIGRHSAGHIRVITALDGKILSASVVGPEARELIAPWVLAMNQGIIIDDLARLTTPAPSLFDVSRQVARIAFATRLRSPWRSLLHRLRGAFK
ncbi:FAD-dependent oxidoreductase [Methylovirgula sp. 4M-Z18]|uniref:FAD-dependent oxidoreductase n=1 Tax=Methylovirgula sp. 4M-Z18 TaxID=2293567 RepID=UPI000E2FA078|nr:NAD(P)/FAD-dependent oxidoreductase [Methylovirgula sp. 4M-Z18]RFB78786.1 NAD(P)/FAD-dependent oxidoreductase [Methylovirgula sp. 4M-Z18]